MKQAKKLIWKWRVPIIRSSANDSIILKDFNYKIIKKDFTNCKITFYTKTALEIYLPYGNANFVVRYLRNLGLNIGVEFGNGNYKDGVYCGGGGCMKLESPLLNDLGGLKPEYKILKENNIKAFEELFNGTL
jgi:hypothetical protein